MGNESTVILLALTTILVMGAFCVVVIWRMQGTIDALTNKVMAKDYREYTAAKPGARTVSEPKLEQWSWFDDPHEVKEADA